MMKIRDISISTCLALLLMGCVAKPPMATESEMKEAAAFAFNVDASQVTISDAKQQDVKTNFVATIGKTSHRCYVTKAAEPKLYGLIPWAAAVPSRMPSVPAQPDASEQNLRRPVEKSGPLLSLCAGEGR
jgi:hypothetical protein